MAPVDIWALICLALHYVWMFAFYYYLIMVPIAICRRVTTKPNINKQQSLAKKTLLIVFGSGGHTTEMLLMLASKKTHEFDFKKYKEVHFVIGHSDNWSMTKIKDFFA